MGEAVEKFLAEVNGSFKNLIDHSGIEEQTALCREFHQVILAFLLQHNIVSAGIYCSDGEGAKPRNQM
uniref:Uncharacterized protein n=1 Tax=Parascaris univalens TaxID=6257 RepID=A0A915BZS5_PARUN